jgi:hypothetical protein
MVRFLSPEWADACKDTINGLPTPEQKAAKLEEFWDWIAMVRPFITGRLLLVVRDAPGGDPDSLALDFAEGVITDAAVVARAEGEPGAVFVLAGDHDDWVAMLGGYDVGKMIMYRKLMLEQGDTLLFFRAAFFWTELLSAIQSIPTETAVPA